VFINPVEYTVDKNFYDVNGMTEESPYNKVTDEIEPEVIHKGMILGAKDKRQVKFVKKLEKKKTEGA
jgi:hypothetical protein